MYLFYQKVKKSKLTQKSFDIIFIYCRIGIQSNGELCKNVQDEKHELVFKA